MLHLFNTSMFPIILFNTLALCISLYQPTLSTDNLFSMRSYKFLSELTAVLLVYHYLCDCSEKLDDCYGNLRRSIENSLWYECSTQTKRDLVFFLVRLQRPNHMKFNQGAIVLSNVFFLKIIKLSYNFVNFFRFMK